MARDRGSQSMLDRRTRTRLSPKESHCLGLQHPLEVGLYGTSEWDMGFWDHGVIRVFEDSCPETEVSVRLVNTGPWVVVTATNSQYSLYCGSP